MTPGNPQDAISCKRIPKIRGLDRFPSQIMFYPRLDLNCVTFTLRQFNIAMEHGPFSSMIYPFKIFGNRDFPRRTVKLPEAKIQGKTMSEKQDPCQTFHSHKIRKNIENKITNHLEKSPKQITRQLGLFFSPVPLGSRKTIWCDFSARPEPSSWAPLP